MNAELQSTNEDLETMNYELRDRTAELNQANEFLEVILGSLGLGVAVIGRDQRVQVWSHEAEELWGMREDEAVDHQFLALDIGLPTEQLAAPLRAVLAGDGGLARMELDAVNRRGRAITCTTTVMPLVSPDGDEPSVRGAIVLMQVGSADGSTGGGNGGAGRAARRQD